MSTFAIRVDGNHHVGMGHLFRCMFLADYIREAGGDVEFLSLSSSINTQMAEFFTARGLHVVRVSHIDDPWRVDKSVLEAVYGSGRYAGVVMDLLVPDPGDDDLLCNEEYVPADVDAEMRLVRDDGLPLCVFSDCAKPMTFQAEIVVNTCPVQQHKWYARNTDTRYFLGPEGYVLARSFAQGAAQSKVFRQETHKVVIFCGGNDHRGFTPIILDGIEGSGTPLQVEVVLGAATPDGRRRAEELNRRGVRVQLGAEDLAPILFDADFVFSTSGNTLFDLAALGIPCAAVSTRERQRVTARFFQRKGSCIDLGRDILGIRKGVSKLCQDLITKPSRLMEMSQSGRAAVDGKGGRCIASQLLSMI